MKIKKNIWIYIWSEFRTRLSRKYFYTGGSYRGNIAPELFKNKKNRQKEYKRPEFKLYWNYIVLAILTSRRRRRIDTLRSPFWYQKY